MATKYFVDTQGNYLGGFDGAEPPVGAIEVPTPPGHGLDKWNGATWVKDSARLIAEHNAPILEQIKTLDEKRIRPLAEGDTTYLSSLNSQIKALREQLL